MTAVFEGSRLPAPLVLALAYGAGSVPVANLVARWRSGVDLRDVGTGTVSGSGLYEVSGFGPLAAAGCVELSKGALGPLLAGPTRPGLGRLAATAAIAAHNWSPWIGWQGGRGVSLLLGATAVSAPDAGAVLAAGLAGGRLARRSGLGTFLGLLAMPLAALVLGRGGVEASWRCLMVSPVLAKRLVGNQNSWPSGLASAISRLLGDREPVAA